MTVTTSAQVNGDQVVANLPAGAGFTSTGAGLTSAAAKTLTGLGCTDAQLQAAITAAASSFIDRDGNLASLQAKASNAIANNVTFLGIAAPTQAQAVAQVQALTRQVDAIIRVLLGLFDSTAGT